MNGMSEASGGDEEGSPGQAHPLAIYYAFKQAEAAEDGITSAGWASFLQAVVDAGLSIDGTWPIRTEISNRMISQCAPMPSPPLSSLFAANAPAAAASLPAPTSPRAEARNAGCH